MDRARNDESFLEPEMRHGFVILLLATNDDLESEKIQTDDFLVVHPRYEHRRDRLTDLSSPERASHALSLAVRAVADVLSTTRIGQCVKEAPLFVYTSCLRHQT